MKSRFSIAHLGIAMLAAVLVTACSRGPMPPTESALGKVVDNMKEVDNGLTEREIENGKASEKGKKAMIEKVMVEPFQDAGYDLDATLEDFTIRLREGNFTQEQGAVITGFMSIYGEAAEDLARFGFIKEQTLNDLKRVYKNSKARAAEAEAEKQAREEENRLGSLEMQATEAIQIAQIAAEDTKRRVVDQEAELAKIAKRLAENKERARKAQESAKSETDAYKKENRLIEYKNYSEEAANGELEYSEAQKRNEAAKIEATKALAALQKAIERKEEAAKALEAVKK
jgi:hypothetical protein